MKKNEYIKTKDGEYQLIITQRNGLRHLVKISPEDITEVIMLQWHVSPNNVGQPYARANVPVGRGKTILLHRFIMKPNAVSAVDHINHNTLDNRRENLRVCTHSENLMNSGPRRGRKYKGVYRQKNGRYQAMITIGDRQKHLGLFSDEKEAARAVNLAIITTRGSLYPINKV